MSISLYLLATVLTRLHEIFVEINFCSSRRYFGWMIRYFLLKMPHTDALFQRWVNTEPCRNITDLTCFLSLALSFQVCRIPILHSSNLSRVFPREPLFPHPSFPCFVSSSCTESVVVILAQGCTLACAPSTVMAGKCLCCYMRKDTNRKANYSPAVIYLSTIWQEHSTAKYMTPS